MMQALVMCGRIMSEKVYPVKAGTLEVERLL